ncbi:TPA: hypothetical protein SMG11_003172 [Serratia marcescens]|uniref:hypothetical protein n=1 Tax=Enterobacterales TaxID=91347 RepID=UPI000A534E26|nr:MULTISPECIES: hypothetical protein [Enterobacterales]EGS5470663.1 hypothetical protein [Serratia marcescens]EGT0061624.1 hypothetical protein [Serratia marcescens]EIM3524808.1 hypothetical protein [Serratia marcescens]EIT1094361.1 hypothetical protein [Serratia marcescens]ELH4242213.1 hypothetical protein [Serratia marcescens]
MRCGKPTADWEPLADKIGAQLRVTEGLDDRGIGFIIDLPESYRPQTESEQRS